jgi:hypothetical protein
LSPDFQRNPDIWSDKNKSRLIESLILCIPIPSFYFDATKNDKWLVIDGLQRLGVIKNFVVDKNMPLTGLEYLQDHNGSKFDDLPRSFRRNITEAQVTLVLMEPGTPDDIKFTIFRRINTGGLPLSPQEIRHAINQGKVTTLLKDLANSKEFKNAICETGIASKRMDDRECITRFFAFQINPPEGYNNDDFDDFLNKAMEAINKMSDTKINELVCKFKKAMTITVEIFGNDAFRKRYDSTATRFPVNKALFEAWSVN